MPKKTPKERIREKIDKCYFNGVHNTQDGFNAVSCEKHIDQATNSILKILKDSVLSEDKLNEIICNNLGEDPKISFYGLAITIREQQLARLK